MTIFNLVIPGVNAADYGFYSDRPVGTVVFHHNVLTNNAFNPILIEHPFGSTDVHHNTISGHFSTAYFNFTYSANDVTTLQRVADNNINAAISFVSGFQGSTGRFTNVSIVNNTITTLGATRVGIGLSNQALAASAAAGAIENPVISGNIITGTNAATSTLLDHTALDTLLPLCERRQIGVLMAAPFNSGILATGARPGATYFYTEAEPAIIERVRRIEALCARHGVAIAAAALQFPLGNPAIASVVTGMRDRAEAVANLAHVRAAIPSAFWTELKHEGLIASAAPIPASAWAERLPCRP